MEIEDVDTDIPELKIYLGKMRFQTVLCLNGAKNAIK